MKTTNKQQALEALESLIDEWEVPSTDGDLSVLKQFIESVESVDLQKCKQSVVDEVQERGVDAMINGGGLIKLITYSMRDNIPNTLNTSLGECEKCEKLLESGKKLLEQTDANLAITFDRKRLNAEVSELQKQLESKTGIIKNLEEQIDRRDCDWDVERETFKKQLEEKQSEVEYANDNYNLEHKSVLARSETITNLQEQLEAERESRNEADSRANTNAKMVSDKLNEISDIMTQLESERAAHAETKQRLAEYEPEQLPTREEVKKEIDKTVGLMRKYIWPNACVEHDSYSMWLSSDGDHNPERITGLRTFYATPREVQEGDLIIHTSCNGTKTPFFLANTEGGENAWVSENGAIFTASRCTPTGYRVNSSGKIVPIKH